MGFILTQHAFIKQTNILNRCKIFKGTCLPLVARGLRSLGLEGCRTALRLSTQTTHTKKQTKTSSKQNDYALTS